MNPLDYEVIATGSTGNAVRIENILIDCGIPFAKLAPALPKVNTLLITHSHGDHVKPTTLMSIMAKYPRIEICGNADVAYRWHVNRIIGETPFVIKGSWEVTPIAGVHDVPVTYFVLKHMPSNTNVLYATDTTRYGIRSASNSIGCSSNQITMRIS